MPFKSTYKKYGGTSTMTHIVPYLVITNSNWLQTVGNTVRLIMIIKSIFCRILQNMKIRRRLVQILTCWRIFITKKSNWTAKSC